MLLEHLLVGELLRHLWVNEAEHIEVLRPQVDDNGYDLVMECGSVVRHVQLKASHKSASTNHVKVQLALGAKPSGCVIWALFDADSFELGPFRWFGGAPGKPLPDISDFKVAKHTKADSTGTKAERPNLRQVPKGKFQQLGSIAELAQALFG